MGILHVQALENKPLIYYGAPCSVARNEIIDLIIVSCTKFCKWKLWEQSVLFSENKMYCSQRDDSTSDNENAQQ